MKQKLEKILNNRNKKILFAGVGNVLRSDDGVGVYIVSAIRSHDNISTIIVETSIENYISKINSLSPGPHQAEASTSFQQSKLYGKKDSFTTIAPNCPTL